MSRTSRGPGRRRDIITVCALVAAVIAFLAVNAAIGALTHEDDGRDAAAGRPAATAQAPAKTKRKGVRSTPLALCETTAPKAVKAYVTASPDRQRLLRRYFAPHAGGLNIPVSHIAPQPAEKFAGFLNEGTPHATATCSVSTGLESPWILDWEYSAESGWLCTSIAGPMGQAYEQRKGETK